MSINETIAEVLRFDDVMTEDGWYDQYQPDGGDVWVLVDPADARDMLPVAMLPALDGAMRPGQSHAQRVTDAQGIAYYRTAAPALAREVQRLQAEVKDSFRREREMLDEARTENARLARELQDLQERHRLTLQERDRAQADARRIVAVREELAALLGTEDIAEAVAEVKRLQALAEVRAVGCACGDDDACMFVRQRDAAHKHGQEAMRERARGACRAARREYGSILSALGDAYAWGWQDALDRAESAIRALEVQP